MRLFHGLIRWALKMRGYGSKKVIPNVEVIYLESGSAMAGVALIFTEEAVFFAKEACAELRRAFSGMPATFGEVSVEIIHAGSFGSVGVLKFARKVQRFNTLELHIDQLERNKKLNITDYSVLTWVSEDVADLLTGRTPR